jgi:Bax protein
MERVPYEMIMGQAALESAWGTSRFAIEGNNLFGIRTWGDHPGMLPKGFPKSNPWQVRVFPSKCASVKEYVRILNNHPAYEEFRKLRTKQLVMNNNMDAIALIKTLTKFSTTPDYAERVIRIIERVRKLENTVATDKAVNEPKKKVPPKEKVSNIVLPKDKPEEIK